LVGEALSVCFAVQASLFRKSNMQKLKLDLLASVACLLAVLGLPIAQAFSFDDLVKVEKVERDERKVREAKAEKARREEETRRKAEEARRQAQLQSEEAARQRENSGSGSSGGGGGYSSNTSGGKYSVYKDKGEAAAWSWFKREIVVSCEGGRNNGSLPSIYLSKSGRWETTYAGKFDTFQAAATAACS
jgi:hypothetical protein